MPENNENRTNVSVAPTPQHIPSKNTLGIPIAIVLAAALIAVAIVYTGSQKSGNAIQNGKAGAPTEQVTKETEVAPVTDKDHIRGNPNAPIVIVEYSDFECPFCKNFHETMNKVMAEYGVDGQVAWVYRNYPIVQLHPNAPKIAEASECVASIGGNDAFWKFSDFVFGERGVNEPTDITRLPEFAEKSGVNKAKFNECLTAGTFADAVTESIIASQKAGAQGTPYSILMVGNQQGVINGAQPYTTVKQMIETMLKQVSAE
jgi:protein-disulfide isomerase